MAFLCLQSLIKAGRDLETVVKACNIGGLCFKRLQIVSCASIACHVGKNALGPEEQPHIYKSDAIWEAIAIQVK
ncbi:hypothetical protein WN944_011145 [Citrus x changshan-huyou]|uniref:Uncharacterized protein n=1 Tax=Citrus x changshan-huyou TaxID=2935761 RepID=A0AAP0MWD4_9ROSI